MIFLYILLGILILLILFFQSSVRFYISYTDEFTFVIRYLFLKFDILKMMDKFSEKEKKPRKERKKKKSKKIKEDEQENKKGVFSSMIKDKGVMGLLNFLKDLSSTALGTIWEIFLRINCKDFNLKLQIAGEDSAATAINYGYVCSIVFTMCAFLQNNIKIKQSNVSVIPAFHLEETAVAFEANFKLKVGYVIKPIFRKGIKFIIGLIKNNIKTGGA